MALTNIGTGGSELSEVLPSEYIQGWLESNYQLFPSNLFAWITEQPDGTGRTWALQRAANLTLSGSAANTEENTDTDIDPEAFNPDEATVSVVDYAVKLAFSEQAADDAALPLDDMYISNIMMGLMELRENEVGGALLSAANTTDLSGQALDHDGAVTAVYALFANDSNPGSAGYAGYLHSVQMRDLARDGVTSQAASFASLNASTVGGSAVADPTGRAVPTMTVAGVPFYATNAVQAEDGSNYRGAVGAAGDGGSIVVVHRRVKDLTGTPQLFALRRNSPASDTGLVLNDILIGWTRFGTGITNDNNLMGIISSQ